MEEEILKLNGFNLHIIKTKKFKFNNVDVCFTNKFDSTNYLSTLIMFEYIKNCSKKYSNNYKMKLALNDLYCAKLGTILEPNCGILFKTFSIKYFRDQFTEKGNELACLEFLKEILFNPTFSKTEKNNLELDIIKNGLLDECNYREKSIKDLANEKFSKIFIDDESYNANSLITKDKINSITLKDLEKSYLDIINNDSVDIFIIGDFNRESINKITSIFSSNKVYVKYEINKNNYEDGNEIENIIDDSRFKQSILKIGYKANLTYREYRYTYRILNNILGGNGLSSRLMSNIREKNSLCYSIYSTINPFYGILVVTSGISSKNYGKVKNMVYKELDDIVKGNITENDISDAKLAYLSLIKDLFDRYYSILDYFKFKYFLDLEDIETRKEEINNITKEEVIELAKKFKKDCVLLLKGDDSNE